MMLKEKEYNYDIHGLLKISSNFSGLIPDSFLVKEKPQELDIIMRMEKKIGIPETPEYSQIAPGLLYNERSKSVISIFRICGFNMAWRLKNLLDTPTEVFVSKAYKDIVRMPVSTVHPLNDYIKFILQIKLVLKGYAFLLAGAFRPADSDFTALVSSCGGIGKTTTVLSLLKQFGGEFLSDDSVIISRDKVYSYPTDIRIRKLGSPVLSYNKNMPFSRILPKESIAKEPLPAKYIFFLERADKSGVLRVDSSSALNKIISINRKTIPYLTERSILAYFYAVSSPGLSKIMESEEGILSDFLSHLDCYVVKCRNPEHYAGLIAGIIRK